MRILVVDDSADDFELIKASVTKGGLTADYVRVDTAGEMIAELRGPAIDLVLCDYNMPNFSAEEALRLLRTACPDVPLILVSGKIGEVAAVQMMKAGANDYVSKSHLNLLPPAIDRALREHESGHAKRAAEDALKSSEAQLRQIIDLMPQLIFAKDWDEKLLLANKAYVDFYGHNEGNPVCPSTASLDEDRAVMIEGQMITIAETVHDAAGAKHEMGTTKVPYKYIGEEGEQTYAMLGVSHDLTDVMRREKEKQEALEKLKATLKGTVNVTLAICNLRDPYTAGHSLRVTQLATAIARELGYGKRETESLEIAGKLHDVGKISVPAEILNKPGRLSDTEMSIIKVHAQAGYDILKESELDKNVLMVTWQHHERNDGSGYPKGLKQADICFGAQILMVADVVEAMSSHRPYRPALGVEAALEEIIKNRGTLFTPEVVDICIRLFKECGFAFSDG